MRTALLSALLLLASAANAGEADMARVPGGVFEPPYAQKGEKVLVGPFRIDRTPVTNAQFLAFVTEHPEWQKGAVPEILAEPAYLERWEGAVSPGPRALPDAPVTGVSWYAAQAYCEARGARLPAVAEWEVAARASETMADASSDPAFQQRLLDWYAVPTPDILPSVGSRPPNLFGIHDLHGLVWEWVYDYASVMIQSETRSDGSSRQALVCGGGALGSLDPREYATYLRYALRGGLKGNYVLRNLGFRCAMEDS